MTAGKIIKVSGTLVVADNMRRANVFDAVRIGEEGIIGEITAINGSRASVQVYEEISGIGSGDAAVLTELPLYAELGPGLIGNIFDGILRPLDSMYKNHGANMFKGIDEPSLDRKKKWKFTPVTESGAKLIGGDIIGMVEETPDIVHKIMIPPNFEGEIIEIYDGEFTVEEAVGTILMLNGEISELFLVQRWAVRHTRPYAKRFSPDAPVITGEWLMDSLFPLMHGGVACVSGTFGSGKTAAVRKFANQNDADVIVYIGCGTRGSEIAEIFGEFSEMKEPENGRSLMQKTVMIANTADMSPAARETSVYSGMTVAEYFRDMGYSVAVVIDSVSGWAEALREMAGKLEEMPDRENCPAYFTPKWGQLCERAGKVVCLGIDERTASLSIVGTVSANDTDNGLADPVIQTILRSVGTFWRLDKNPYHHCNFPSINISESYSLHQDIAEQYFSSNINVEAIGTKDTEDIENADKTNVRTKLSDIIQESLKVLRRESILRATGIDESHDISDIDILTLEAAKLIREKSMTQDTSVPSNRHSSKKNLRLSADMHYALLCLIIKFHQSAENMLKGRTETSTGMKIEIDMAAGIEKILRLPVWRKIAQTAFTDSDNYRAEYEQILQEIDTQFSELSEKSL